MAPGRVLRDYWTLRGYGAERRAIPIAVSLGAIHAVEQRVTESFEATMNRHQDLADAIASLYPRLPELFGQRWVDVDVLLTSLLRELEGGAANEAEEEVFELFASSPPALDALNVAVSEITAGRTRGGQKAPDDPVPSRARCVRIPVFYGTDRGQIEGADGQLSYSGERGDTLRFGRAEVSIPDDHRMGRVERPRWWRLEFRQDPEKHVVISGIQELEGDKFVEAARAVGTASGEALVFVHGYNVDFDSALRRTAQVAYDLHFDGLAMLFSWPSRGTATGYFADETSVRWAQEHFREFLTLIANRLGLSTVHVLAHSMGNRVVSEVLGADLPIAADASSARFDQIVFAAPDIDTDTFRQLARQFHQRAGRCTLYASSKDLALEQSQRFHGAPRAGDSERGILVTQGIDAIDATGVDTSLLGHSYYGDKRSLLSDLFNLFRERKGPDDRFGLLRRQVKGGQYWEFRP
jgi:esterase/lipase superfamily enzyme